MHAALMGLLATAEYHGRDSDSDRDTKDTQGGSAVEMEEGEEMEEIPQDASQVPYPSSHPDTLSPNCEKPFTLALTLGRTGVHCLQLPWSDCT